MEICLFFIIAVIRVFCEYFIVKSMINQCIMLSVKLKFKPSAIMEMEGRLYYQVVYNRKIRYIATPYRIFPNEWDCVTGEIIVTNSSNRVNYLESVVWAFGKDKEHFRRIVRELSCYNMHFSIDTVVMRFNKQSNRNSLFDYMQHVIAKYRKHGQYRTSETYLATLNSFSKFRGNVDVDLGDIDCELLEMYESYLKLQGLSPNTISFYMKHLRAIYNKAVDDDIVMDRKPFRRVFTSVEKTVKRAVSLKTIKQLKLIDYSDYPSRRFAQDMFLFSFYTRGMSFVDIAYLRKDNLKGNVLLYRRKKTNQQLIIHWEPCMQEILRKYSADTSSPYLFSIIKDCNQDVRKQYRNALYLVNRHLKEIGKNIGLSLPLTMYCARHSWASIARDEGVPISVISEGMGHDSEKTTQIYLASLKTEVIDRANRKILKLL